jgi:hypothetical protein
MSEKYPQEFLDLLNSVESKRSRTVIQHILKYEFITHLRVKHLKIMVCIE